MASGEARDAYAVLCDKTARNKKVFELLRVEGSVLPSVLLEKSSPWFPVANS